MADHMDSDSVHGEELVAVKVLTAQFLQQNPDIQLSTEADIITLEADEADPRAKMPCGHGITPSSLTQYMRSLVTEKRENTIRCCAIRDPTKETTAQARQNQGSGAGNDPICNETWEYPTCRKLALLTQEEKAFFEAKLSANFANVHLHMKSCPKCKTCYYRDARDPATATNSRTACLVCEETFCYRCGLTWKNPNNQLICGNDPCVASLTKVVEILQTCPTKKIDAMRTPLVRACPYPACLSRFPQLVEHVGGCKFMRCPSCGGSYCHACLTTFVKNGHIYPSSCNGVEGVCANPAPRQTMADVKKGQA